MAHDRCALLRLRFDLFDYISGGLEIASLLMELREC
jgi:hypothetical protein